MTQSPVPFATGRGPESGCFGLAFVNAAGFQVGVSFMPALVSGVVCIQRLHPAFESRKNKMPASEH
jgi:hypothetical protein